VFLIVLMPESYMPKTGDYPLSADPVAELGECHLPLMQAGARLLSGRPDPKFRHSGYSLQFCQPQSPSRDQHLGEKALLRRPISSSKQFSVYGVAFASMLFNQSPRSFRLRLPNFIK
jgi:hypothetical protein